MDHSLPLPLEGSANLLGTVVGSNSAKRNKAMSLQNGSQSEPVLCHLTAAGSGSGRPLKRMGAAAASEVNEDTGNSAVPGFGALPGLHRAGSRRVRPEAAWFLRGKAKQRGHSTAKAQAVWPRSARSAAIVTLQQLKQLV